MREMPECSLNLKISPVAPSLKLEFAKRMGFTNSKVRYQLYTPVPRTLANRIEMSAETLIVWTEPTNGVDMALSFQEAEGCGMIWLVFVLNHRYKILAANKSRRKFINSIQQQYNPTNTQGAHSCTQLFHCTKN